MENAPPTALTLGVISVALIVASYVAASIIAH